MKWKEFKNLIEKESPDSCRFSVKDAAGASKMLFRGQANSSWKIETTLERAGHKHLYLDQYMRDCDSARRYMGNLFPSELPFETDPDCSYQKASRTLPNYEYMAFLRHHGFPSPLLDWTESPFVAAFFAFRDIPKDAETVTIFGYREYSNHIKGWSSSDASIFTMGPFASIHERHIAQQCQYTYCIKGNEGSTTLCPHEDCFSDARTSSTNEQNLLEKWEIEKSERQEVLGDLFQMNITPFSLFRSVDSAAETAALRIL